MFVQHTLMQHTLTFSTGFECITHMCRLSATPILPPLCLPNPTLSPTPSPTPSSTPSPTLFPTPSPTLFPTPSPALFPTPSPASLHY